MIRHIVLFTLRAGVCAEEPRVAQAVQASRRLARLPSARSWQFEANVSPRDVAADFAGIGDFDDTNRLDDFLRHPDHVVAGEQWAGLATWVIADLDLPRQG